MIEYLKTWRSLKSDRRGVTAVEYAILAGVVIIALAGAGASFGTKITTAFSNIGTSLTNETPIQGGG